MAIKVVGNKSAQRYTTTCTDKKCLSILEFDHSDIGYNSVYSMGREAGSREGVVCPKCNQVLRAKDFTKIESVEDAQD